MEWRERFDWAAGSSVSVSRLAGSAITSAISTARNQPYEFGPGWSGYGKRVGTRVLTGGVENFTEAGIGGLWGEDPRYHRKGSGPVRGRIWHSLKMSVAVRNETGGLSPAYARYIAVPAVSAMSNAWRPSSERTASATVARIPMSFLGRIAANGFSEFWPDLKRRFR
jgi:hypothetical protein